MENKVIDIAWSPNNLKLAVASSDRTIYLFDENGVKRDKFSTKPVDPKVLNILINFIPLKLSIFSSVNNHYFSHSLARRAIW